MGQEVRGNRSRRWLRRTPGRKELAHEVWVDSCFGRLGTFLHAWLSRLAPLLLTGGLAANLGAVAAPRRVEITADAPSLLFVRMATGDAGTARESRLYQELGLALDRFALISVEAERGFAQMPLGQQLASIQDLVDREGAVAVTWLGQPAPGQLLLHLVVAQTGRVLVRSIQAQPGSEKKEANLAVAVRELLGTAYLFEPAPSPQGAAAIREVVEEVRQRVAPSPAPPPLAPSSPGKWRVVASFHVGQGVGASFGGLTQWGGGLAGGRRVSERVWLDLGVEGDAGPVGGNGDVSVAGWRVGPHFGAFWGLTAGPFTFGPHLGLQLDWRRLQSYRGDQALQQFSSVEVRVIASAQVRWKVTPALGVVLAPRLALCPQSDVFLLRSTQAVVATTPLFEWGAVVGVALELGAL